MSPIQTLTGFYTKPRVYQRVLISIPLAFWLSHMLLFAVDEKNTLSILLVKQIGAIFVVAMLIGWVLVAGSHNLKTYVRIMISAWWAVLLQRVIFDSASGGKLFFQVSAFMALSLLLAFAVTGLQTNEFIRAVEDKKYRREVFLSNQITEQPPNQMLS